MAIKAFASVAGHTRDNADFSKVRLQVNVSILGGNEGTYPSSDFILEIPGMNPGLTTLLYKEIIATVVRADMENHGISFGLFDSVVVYPLLG